MNGKRIDKIAKTMFKVFNALLLILRIRISMIKTTSPIKLKMHVEMPMLIKKIELDL